MKNVRAQIVSRSLASGIIGLLALPASSPGFSLIDSVSQTGVCSSSGNFDDIVTNPNDHCWWGTPPLPPGPVIVRYRFTPAFDAAFPNTVAHPDLNAQIKAQVDRAFDTWERANVTPQMGAATYLRTGADPTFVDIRSVALHEIGHVLGLHHPDQAVGVTRNFCPAAGGFGTCAASGGEVMNSFINQGNINHILSFDELNGFNFMYPVQTFQFQRVGTTDPAEIDIDTRVAGSGNWALATLCGIQRVPMTPLQGRRTLSGRVQFNTASLAPMGFRTLGINWDFQCNSIATSEFRIQTHGTDNPNLFARYDGPAAGHPFTFQNYGNSPVGNLKDDLLHTWRNPNTPIPVSGLIHVGIEMDVWDWTVVSATAVNAAGTSSMASLVSSHSWNNLFNEGAGPAPAPAPGEEGDLSMGPQQPITARGIVLRTSDAPVNRLTKLAVADVTGLQLQLRDLNRVTLEKLRRENRVEFIEQFQPREIRGNGEFVVVFEGKEGDLPPKLRESGNYIIVPRPQYPDRQLMVFVESSTDESTTGTFALIGSPPIINMPGAGLPRLEITLLGNEKVLICWPDPSTGFTLESTSQLNPPRWTPVEAQVEIKNGKKCVTLTAEKTTFYRLINRNPDTCFPFPGQECLD